MDLNSLLARVAGGFAVRAAALAGAAYVAHSAWVYVASVFGQVSHALPM